MKAVGFVWDITLLLLGGTVLFAGLDSLATAPFLAVLTILGAMAVLLVPAARLCGADLRLDSSGRSTGRSTGRSSDSRSDRGSHTGPRGK